MEIQEKINAAAKLLDCVWSTAVEIQSVEPLRDGRCFRLFLRNASAVLPKTVIVKVTPDEPGCAIDSNAVTPNPAQAILEEWAGLIFLNECLPHDRLVPRFYGGDRDAAIVIVEDLGHGKSLLDALQGTDDRTALEALLQHADALSVLHSSTLGREERYIELRDALGPAGVPRNWKRYGSLLATQGWGHLGNLRDELARSFAFLGQSVGDAFWAEYDALTSAIHGSSAFRAYVHNDTCLDNSLMTAGGVRLIDFERGGYHHCLLDVAYYRLGMPHCFWAGRLPSDVVTKVEQHYRESIAPFIPEAAEKRRFGNALTDACAYWNISGGIWMLAKHFAADFNWGNSSWRQRVLFRLEQFAAATEEFGHLSVI